MCIMVCRVQFFVFFLVFAVEERFYSAVDVIQSLNGQITQIFRRLYEPSKIHARFAQFY